MEYSELEKQQRKYILALRCYEEVKSVVDKIAIIGTVLESNNSLLDSKLRKSLSLSLLHSKEAEKHLSELEEQEVKLLLRIQKEYNTNE